MSNKLFYEACFRDTLPIFEKFVGLGWPEKLYPWFLAKAQLPDADTAAQKALTLHMGDCIRNGTLRAQRQQVAWADNKLVEPHITPADFAAWLQREGIEPSPLIREWLTHYGITYAGTNQPGATHTAKSAAAIRPEGVDSFDGLCQYRKQFADLERQKRPEWTAHERKFLLQQHEAGMRKADLSRALGFGSASTVKRQLKKAKEERDQEQAAATRAKQNPQKNVFEQFAQTRARS